MDRLLYQKEKPFWLKVLLLPLTLFSLPYEWGVRTRATLYTRHFWKSKRLPCPVISVGNITVGGTGKTPLVIMLAKGLTTRGVPTAILTRGYKGKGSSGPLVSDGKRLLLLPEESGDEPFQMAKTLKGIPILIGKDRLANGQLAIQRFNIRGLLLDDGYQYLQLHRDLNILLIDSAIAFGDHHLLPRGILREPLDHLRRAHLFLITKVEDPQDCLPLEKLLREIHPSPPIFHSHYEPSGLMGSDGTEVGIGVLKEKKVLAVSGIANPAYFSFLLRRCGVEIIREMVFPDHHRFTSKDLIAIERESRGLDWIVTTEKDIVKLSKIRILHLPLLALRIEMKIWEEEEFYRKVMEIF
ncbi:MAG: tetraacyldisaccharide 4'-kinase [Thermodesulfobacteriota bacterium]